MELILRGVPLALEIVAESSSQFLQEVSQNYPHLLASRLKSQELLQLGRGNWALRLEIQSDSPGVEFLRKLQSIDLMGGCLDYLPSLRQGPFRVEVWPLSKNGASLASFDLAEWLQVAARCSVGAVVKSFTEHHSDRSSALVELGDLASWQRALALNGMIVGGTVVAVWPAEDSYHMQTRMPRQLTVIRGPARHAATSAISEMHLRAICRLPSTVRCLILTYLRPLIRVPEDSCLGTALSSVAVREGATILMAPGRYELPDGLLLSRRCHMKIIGRGAVELVLGQPITVRSIAGARLQNLTLRAPTSVKSLVQVLSTYAHACATGSPPGERKRVTFARCSQGQPALVLENCRLVGGHHGLDARGSFGLRPQRQANGWDIGCWLEGCRRTSEEAAQAALVPSEVLHDLQWVHQFGTRVILRDCEISFSKLEAVHVSHGAHLAMERSWVHHCGTGVSVVQCMLESIARIPFVQRTPTGIRLTENRFEDIGDDLAWSSAISLGSMVSSSGRSSHTTETFITDYRTMLEWPDRGPLWPVEVHLVGNEMRRCNIGIIAHAVKLMCTSNKLWDLKLAGWQLLDSLVDLADNILEGCGGVGLGISASAGVAATSCLQRNRIVGSERAVRVTAHEAPCKLTIADHVLEGNGDGFTITGFGAHVEVKRCTVQGNRRHGIFVGRAAHALLLENNVVGNGRGVAIADGSADVRRCRFEGNTGWAIRLSEPPFNPAGPPEPRSSDMAASVVSENKFAGRGMGIAGRKRILVEPWHGESGAEISKNVEEHGGESVQPLRKRRREVEICTEGLANMSIKE